MFHESNRLSVKVRTNATMPIHTYTTYLDMRCWIPHFPLRCNPTHGCNMSCNVSKSPPAKRPACVARRIEYRPRAEILYVWGRRMRNQPTTHHAVRAAMRSLACVSLFCLRHISLFTKRLAAGFCECWCVGEFEFNRKIRGG